MVLRLLAVILLASSVQAKIDPFARSIQLDPAFAYYQGRSPENIAAEVKADGYGCVRYAVTAESAINVKLVEALHKAGVAVWYTTFGNGTYSTADFPAGWEEWRMRLKGKKAEEAAPGFTYLCMNDPEYRRWKKGQVLKTLKRVPFDGFEIAEPFWPAFQGPDSPFYGCLCDHCRRLFGPTMPDFDKRNTPVYQKWVDFRVKSVVSFHEEILSQVRKDFPQVKIAVWGIADDVPNPVQTIREWEGIDGALLVKTLKPDLFVIQTDWPDWSKPDLPADYPLKYKPFVDAVRSVSEVPIILQADIGSFKNCRRGADWMAECEVAAKKAGMIGITCYEYHLNR